MSEGSEGQQEGFEDQLERSECQPEGSVPACSPGRVRSPLELRLSLSKGGLRPKQRGLRVSWWAIGTTRWVLGQLEGSEGQPRGNGRMDGRKISFYWTLSPTGATAQKTKQI